MARKIIFCSLVIVSVAVVTSLTTIRNETRRGITAICEVGGYLYTSSLNSWVKKWEINGERCLDSFEMPVFQVWDLKPLDNNRLLVGGKKNLLVIDLNTKRELKRVIAHKSGIEAIGLKNNRYAYTYGDRFIKVWDLKSQAKEPQKVLELETSYLYEFRFSEDCNYAIYTDGETIIRYHLESDRREKFEPKLVWDFDNEPVIDSLGESYALDFINGTKEFVVVGEEFVGYSKPNSRDLDVSKYADGDLTIVEYIARNKCVTYSEDRLSLFDYTNGIVSAVFPVDEGYILSINPIANGEKIVVGKDNGNVEIIDIDEFIEYQIDPDGFTFWMEDETFDYAIDSSMVSTDENDAKYINTNYRLFLTDFDRKKFIKSNSEFLKANDIDIASISDDIGMVVISGKNGKSQSSLDSIARQIKGVEVAGPDYLYKAVASPFPADCNDCQQRYFDLIQLREAWDFTKGSRSVKVGVLDEGIDRSHTEFSYSLEKTSNYLVGDHGTHVASLIAGKENNGKCGAGVSPGVRLIGYGLTPSFRGYFNGWDIEQGMEYLIAQGADIVNVSLGSAGSGSRSSYLSSKTFWERVLKNASENGVIVVKAAGNDDIDAVYDPSNIDDYAIVVGSVDGYGKKSDFSNYGDLIDIWAPGDGYTSYGRRGLVASGPSNSCMIMKGTSMAAPVLTGVLALMLSVDDDLSLYRARSILRSSASQLDGRPVVNAYAALKTLQGGNYSPDPNPGPSLEECDHFEHSYDVVYEYEYEHEYDRVEVRKRAHSYDFEPCYHIITRPYYYNCIGPYGYIRTCVAYERYPAHPGGHRYQCSHIYPSYYNVSCDHITRVARRVPCRHLEHPWGH